MSYTYDYGSPMRTGRSSLWKTSPWNFGSQPALSTPAAPAQQTKSPWWMKWVIGFLAIIALIFLIAFAVIYGQNADIINDGDQCAEGPCQNGGTCVDKNKAYVCACPMFYSGTNCEIPYNACTSSSCNGKGTCQSFANGGTTCTCNQHYTGPNCATLINFCTSGPCKNGATCSPSITPETVTYPYTCCCAPGYTGRLCDTDIDDCASSPCNSPNGACVDGTNSYTCNCNTGYSGTHCEIAPACNSNPCINGGTCAAAGVGYTCTCVTDFDGDNCENVINQCTITGQNPCFNFGRCTDLVGTYSCACPPGYTGDRCETNINECASNPCVGDIGGNTETTAICGDLVNAYKCDCTVIEIVAIAAGGTAVTLDSECAVP